MSDLVINGDEKSNQASIIEKWKQRFAQGVVSFNSTNKMNCVWDAYKSSPDVGATSDTTAVQN